MKLNQIIDVKKWPRRKMQVGYGTRPKIVLKQTKKGRVYFMAKTYGKDIGELRSEVCASLIGRFFGFAVQKTWFCYLPSLKMFPHNLGVLVQLDVRRQKETRRDRFKENLVHGGDLITLVDKDFAKLNTLSERRNAYTLDIVISALRNYYVKNPAAKNIWRHFFELLVFDALIGGTDRHYNNWGILEKTENQNFLRLAPAFDNGISLLWKLDEYYPKFMKDLFTRKFITKLESIFKKRIGGKYDLYEILNEFYSIPELRGSGLAKKILDRLNKVKIGYLRMVMVKNIPQSKAFRSEQRELYIVYEYVKMRLEILKKYLQEINATYG